MASTYYDSAGKSVVAGDIAYAADINDINNAVDSAFQQVEVAINAVSANQSYYSDLAEAWAINPEDSEVEPGSYSALHWSAKAEDNAVATSADRVQTGLDKVATAADRVQTGLDKVATAADRVQTGLDVIATAADKVAIEGIVDNLPNQSFRNKVINGNFDIWQRGTSLLGGTGTRFMADRWAAVSVNSSIGYSRQDFPIGTFFTGSVQAPKHFLQVTCTPSSGASDYALLQHKFEDVTRYQGKSVTLSFYAKRYVAGYISIEFVQDFGTGGSPSSQVYTLGGKVNPSAAWDKITLTVTLPSISGKTLGTDNNSFLALNIWVDAGSSFNTRTDSLGHQSGVIFDFSTIQLEDGTEAAAFEQRPYSVELALCQRYYETGSLRGVCACYNVAAVQLPTAWYKVTKRIVPTITLSNVTTQGMSGTIGTLSGTAATIEDFAPYYNWTSGTQGQAGKSTFDWVADAEFY